MTSSIPPHLLDQMRRDWDDRARENARHYIATGQSTWTDREFFDSGEANVREQIMNDLINICQGRDAADMRVLEIGCGAGRITRALASRFGRVDGVDVSGEMIAAARKGLEDVPNVHFHQNNGADLRMFGDAEFDFAFSFIVFQHIPSKAAVASYLHEVARVLRPGRLFKLQVGGVPAADDLADTWNGVGFSAVEIKDLAEGAGFEMRYTHGAETQYFWLWLFKR